LRGRLLAGVIWFCSVIGRFSIMGQHCAAPTTKSPAERFGQGCSRICGPRFSELTNACPSHEVQWNVRPKQKLRLDFLPASGPGAGYVQRYR
jgi:hypothetical protein